MGLAGNGRCCCCPVGQTELRHFSRRETNPRPPFWQASTALYRSNSHLHHRQTDAFASAIDGCAGERAMSAFSDDNAGAVLADRSCAGPRAYLFRGRIPVRVSKAGGITRFALRRSIRDLHHRRRLGRDHCGQPISRKFYRGAIGAPHFANPLGSLCHRCPAHRLVPSGRPRALGHAPSQREPRDPGLPFRPMPGCSVEPRGGQQKTLRSGRLGRVREKRTVDLAVRQDRSHEPGMRHRIAWGYSACGQFFRSGSTSLGSWSVANGSIREAAGDTPATCGCQAKRV
ncbi:hypothetical protein IQ17_05852 [Bradyrhizobium daqingense]|uniref:Uncharacterized protein n=1 Tax=Bradyrhizobium daqingense TaxID=993502 RepID=A0A562KT92_9BRAD|nr:hypothetical protein IQ17_05852 [Bradyrhizobium daqingense]